MAEATSIGFKLTVGDVFTRTIQVWLKNALPFGLLALLFGTPLLVLLLLNPNAENKVLTWIFTIGNMILQLVVSGALTYGVFQQLRGHHPDMNQCIQAGLSRLVPLLLAGILVGLAVFAGFLALAVPGLILFAGLYVSVPVAVVENPGAVDSLKRSWALTHGNKMTIFLAVVVLSVTLFLAMVPIGIVIGLALSGTIGAVVIQAISYFLSALGGVMGAVVYHDLRIGKEGLQTDDLARVFD